VLVLAVDMILLNTYGRPQIDAHAEMYACMQYPHMDSDISADTHWTVTPPPLERPRPLDPTNGVRAVYEDGVWKFYGPAAAVGKCAGEMQLVVDAGKAVKEEDGGGLEGGGGVCSPADLARTADPAGGREKAHILSPANRSSWQRTRS
jgi:hypothetical protein